MLKIKYLKNSEIYILIQIRLVEWIDRWRELNLNYKCVYYIKIQTEVIFKKLYKSKVVNVL